MKRLLGFWLATLFTLPLVAKTTYISIGTGSMTGVYYPTGGAIAKTINAKRNLYKIRASVESTGGSVYNINAVLKGDLEFGISQSDRQYQAVHGIAEWEGKPQKNLRAVCSFHAEAVTLVAADDSNIKALSDIKGKKINIGNPGSGQRQNALDIIHTAGLNESQFTAEGLSQGEAPKMLQDSRIDAFFFTVGHPSGSIQEATTGARKVHFVPVLNMDKLLAKFPYYAKTEIPVQHYPMSSDKKDVPTIGVKATLVTSANVPEAVVYAITKEIFDNLEQFKKLHPAFGSLTRQNMLEGLSAPLHDGASKYFKEAKLLEPKS